MVVFIIVSIMFAWRGDYEGGLSATLSIVEGHDDEHVEPTSCIRMYKLESNSWHRVSRGTLRFIPVAKAADAKLRLVALHCGRPQERGGRVHYLWAQRK